MIVKRAYGRILIGMMIFLMGLPPAGDAKKTDKDISKIMKDVRKTLKKIKTFSCSFERTYVRKIDEWTQYISGTIFMKKENMFRVDYSGQTIVIDGETVWTYLPKNKQVQISNFEGGEEQFPSPLTIFERYSYDREAVLKGEEKVDDMKCDVVSLVSTDPDETYVTVWIDRKLDFQVKAVEETPSGDVTTHILRDIKLNEKIDDEVFVFVSPEGVTAIDMREREN